MTHARKMALVPAEMVDAVQTTAMPVQNLETSPATKAVLTVDAEMRTILEREDIPADTKIKLYNQTLQRFLKLDDQRKVPLQQNAPSKATDDQGESSDSLIGKQIVETDVLASVPPTLRKKADRLLDKLKSNRKILDWNLKGEILHKGIPVPGTHLVDLINDTLRKRKNFIPKGWREFTKGLAELNTPQDLVGNTDRWQYIQQDQAFPDLRQDATTVDDGESVHVTTPKMYAEAYHLKPSNVMKKGKSRNKKQRHDDQVDEITSSTFPIRWSPY